MLLNAINKIKLDMDVVLTSTYDNKITDLLTVYLIDRGFKFNIVDINIFPKDINFSNDKYIHTTPQNVFKICQNSNLNVNSIENVVKVDSTIVGIYEGNNAGCWTVGLYGNSAYVNIESFEHLDSLTFEEMSFKQNQAMVKMIESGAHFLAPDISYLPNIFENINNRMKYGETPQGLKQQVRFYMDNKYMNSS